MRVVFALDQPFPNHNGGDVVFGPDGFLYLGFGDGGSAGDPLLAGQDRGQLLGSILRIDPRGTDGSAYTIPADNPYADEQGARPEVWLKGVRNPWRFAFDRANGDLWVGDVGQNEVEEIDWLPADEDGTGAGRGANLGWNEMEGSVPFEDGVEPEDHTPPVLSYTHGATGGCSVTGGFVYRGAAIPGLTGAYLFADYCASDLRAIRFVYRGEAIPELFGAFLFTDYCHGELRALAIDREDGDVLDNAEILPDTLESPISFGQDADGELYVMTQPGQLLRIVRGS
jgi:glucose/arabinose dehydrogenase